jgi:hypothetical protein
MCAAIGVPEILKDPLVGFLLAVVGIILSVLFYLLGRRSNSKPRMAYQLNDFMVIGQPDVTSLGEIKILFNNAPVPRVVVTQVAVWNAGNVVVRGSDIVSANPLAVSFGDGALVLHTQRVKATQEVNDFRITPVEDRSQALLEFDYLNARDGATFQIIHTGTKDKSKVIGSIRGIPKGVENWGDLHEWNEQKSRLANSVSGLLPLGAIIVVALVYNWVKDPLSHRLPVLAKLVLWAGQLVGALLTVLIVSIPIFIVYYSLRTRSRTIPKSLSRS